MFYFKVALVSFLKRSLEITLQRSFYGNENGREIIYEIRYLLAQVFLHLSKDIRRNQTLTEHFFTEKTSRTLCYIKAI